MCDYVALALPARHSASRLKPVSSVEQKDTVQLYGRNGRHVADHPPFDVKHLFIFGARSVLGASSIEPGDRKALISWLPGIRPSRRLTTSLIG